MMNKYEKKYAKVMKKNQESMLESVKFLYSAFDFIVFTNKLTEFQDWQVKEAEKTMSACGKNKEDAKSTPVSFR